MKTYKIHVNGQDFDVRIEGIQGSQASVNVNGTDYELSFESTSEDRSETPVVAAASPSVNRGESQSFSSTGSISSPLPGVIIELCVKKGDHLTRGQKVAVLEAMKMENEIQAEFSGTVTEINVKEGDSVAEGAVIVTLQG